MIEKILWNPEEQHESIPQFPCPICEKGLLESKKENLLEEFDTRTQLVFDEFGEIDFDARKVFTGILTCNNRECKEPIVVSGHCTIKPFFSNLVDERGIVLEESIQDFALFYDFDFFYPNLKIFKLESEIPNEIRNQMNRSFSHFFRDLDSCANRMRSAIEILMDEIKAPDTKKITTKPKCPINHSNCSLNNTEEKTINIKTLHQRIENFSRDKEYETVGEMLLAIKIIGNTGSHAGESSLTRKDIIDAYQIIENVFEILFVKKRKKSLSISKEIIAKNKPRSNDA